MDHMSIRKKSVLGSGDTERPQGGVSRVIPVTSEEKPARAQVS